MSGDNSINAGVWGTTAPEVRHGYPLAVRDPGRATAVSLLMRSLPYALARFAILLGCAVARIIWMVVAFGGAAWPPFWWVRSARRI